MKRIISVFLVCLLIIGLSPVTRAAGTPTVSVTSGEAVAGGEVTLTVSIEDNPGVAACLFYIYYDTSVFSVDPSKDISTTGSFRSSGGLIGNTIALAKQNGRYDGAANKDGVLALWYNGSGLDTSEDGSMMTVILHVNADAASGDYAVELGYSRDDTCNQTGENVTFQTAGGTVTVTGGSVQKPDSGNISSGSTGTDGDPAQPDALWFPDVSGHWAEAYIYLAAEAGLVEGYEDDTYRPDNTMTRAEFVTILWRAEGSPEPKGAASFTDLTQNWYKKAVAWAEENKVVNGVGGGNFDPTGSVTREQLVTILHRRAGTPTGMEAMLTSVYDGQYPDSGKIGSWAKAALYWSIYNSIYCGEASVNVGKTLAPKAAANRGQIAVMMVRYLNKQ